MEKRLKPIIDVKICPILSIKKDDGMVNCWKELCQLWVLASSKRSRHKFYMCAFELNAYKTNNKG